MDARTRYDEIVDHLVALHNDVHPAKMMGMPSLRRGGKLVAGFWHDAMVFKLPLEVERKEALALEGAHLFDPSGMGRPMKEWVAVPLAHTADWPRLAELAVKPAD
jgi:hypothetical protein